MFSDLISNYTTNPISVSNSLDVKSISVYPISEYNLEGIKILLDNCMRMGSELNTNVQLATIHPSMWLGDFLDKNWDKISHVTTNVQFTILKHESGKIISKNYKVDSVKFDTEEELNSFFINGKWKKFVLFSVVKYANLSTMNCYYSVRYSDITEKFEERDNKINEILKDGTNNN